MAGGWRPGLVRLRRDLSAGWADLPFPAGFEAGPAPADARRAIHTLFRDTLGEEQADFDAWWRPLSSDPEFEPELLVAVTAPGGGLAGAAQGWTSGFLKSLSVVPSFRRKGIGSALLHLMFGLYRNRGAPAVDLKTDLAANADAVRLYRRAGMIEVGYES